MKIADYEPGTILSFTGHRGQHQFIVVLDKKHWRWLDETNDDVIVDHNTLGVFAKGAVVVGNIDDIFRIIKEKLDGG